MMNRVEKTFAVIEKIIQAKIDMNERSGVIINKGTPDEIRVRYRDLIEDVKSLKYHVVNRNSINRYGICEECLFFEPDSKCENHGKCKNHKSSNYGRCMGVFDNCWRCVSKNMNCTKCGFYKDKSGKWFCSRSGEIIDWKTAKKNTCEDWRYFG